MADWWTFGFILVFISFIYLFVYLFSKYFTKASDKYFTRATHFCSSTSDRQGLCKYLGAKFTEQKRLALGKYLSLASVKYLNERALTSIERDLDTVAHEEIEETGSETAELSNGGKSAWFNLKGTAILYVFIIWCFLFVIALRRYFDQYSSLL